MRCISDFGRYRRYNQCFPTPWVVYQIAKPKIQSPAHHPARPVSLLDGLSISRYGFSPRNNTWRWVRTKNHRTARLWGPQWRRLKSEARTRWGSREMPYHIADERTFATGTRGGGGGGGRNAINPKGCSSGRQAGRQARTHVRSTQPSSQSVQLVNLMALIPE